MARNRIEELLVQLKFQGAEELKKISGGFRELAKAVNLADADIEDARTKIIDYGKTLGNTNQAVKGTIQALKALQDSTNRGGEAWVQLSRDVLGFEQAARLTDREIESLRRGIVAEASAHSQSETSIRAHVSALQQLRAQSVLGGQVNRQLAQSIGQLTQQLNQAEQASRAHFSALNQALAVRPDAVLRQFQAYTEVLRDVRATAEQAAEAQQRLNQLAGAPRIAARRELVARTGIQSDPAYQERFGLAGRSLEELPDVPAALSLRLRELQEDLNFTTRNTQLYVSTLVEMASVQRQASATTQGFAAALREQLASGQLAPTQKNLQEVIGALRREMLELDTTTTEGGRAYAENARQADVLERQLKELASSYRNVADMATQAATAERSSAAARVTALYMSNRAVQEQAQAMRDLGTAVRSGVAGTPLMLPAAGMTSAPGTGQARSGGARRLTGQVETTFGAGVDVRGYSPRSTFQQQFLPTAAVGAPPAVGMSGEALEAQIKMQAKAAKDAAADLSAYRVEIQRAAAANNGSINSIQRYRDSLVTLRNTLPATGAEFKQLSRQVQQLDAQLERSQRRRRRMSATQATQAAGAVISGGIFGGPEGAAGGIAGAVVGGVPGAFAGAAIGAQFGMIRQSLGQMAAFTAEIDKQRIALRNVVGTQAEYERSLQFIDATSRRLAIPQDQLNKQFTQLSASVIGAGGNVDAAKLAFEGIAAGIRGTGGNLSDMQSALLATSQVFSKGKVSAEELRQQIGERLPGAFTIFAQSIGKTPQELDKMLESGEVGLNDFMKFVQELTRRYGSSANEIAASSQSAGDRMATTFARIREAVGRELQPVGAQFQEAFATAFAENEQAIVDFAKSIATAAKVVADNAGLIAESLKVLLGFGAIAAAIPLATSVAATFAKVSLAIASMGGAASVAGLAVKGLIASLLAVSPFGWIAAGVVGLGLLGKAVYDNNEIFKNWVDNIGGVVAGDFRNSMDAMAGDAESATNRISGAFEGLGQNMSSVGNFIQQVFDDLFGFVSQSGASSASQVDNSWADAMSNIGANTSAAFDGLTEMLANWWEALPAPLRNILGGNTASALAGAAQYAAGASSRAAQGGPVGTFGDTGGFGRYGAPSSQVRFRSRRTGSFSFDRGAGAGGGASGGAGKAAKGPESRAAELRIELNLMDQLLEAESLISQAKLENNEREAAILQTLVAQTRLASEAAKLELEKIPAKDKALRLQILTRQSTQESAKLAFHSCRAREESK
jgi:tape measure domain-containing protein